MNDNETIMNFQTLLQKETWESVYIDTDPNHMFNSLLCTFLNISQASFPFKYKSMKDKYGWITQGIKMSCKHK
jgi:alpha-D-ribose 1-methylphosphonate 5-phosphate C-P lyase